MRLELVLDGRKKQEDPNAIEVAEKFIQAFNLYLAKSEGYGTTWKQQGYMGNLARILSKANRLKAMLWNEQPSVESYDEAVWDTATDLMNLAAFFIINTTDQNKWGSE